jgi:hypothetical protein
MFHSFYPPVVNKCGHSLHSFRQIVQNYKRTVLLHSNHLEIYFALSFSAIPLGSCLLPIELCKGVSKLRNQLSLTVSYL